MRKVFFQSSKKEGELAKTFEDWLAKYHDMEIEHIIASQTPLSAWKSETAYSSSMHAPATMGSIFCVLKLREGDVSDQ